MRTAQNTRSSSLESCCMSIPHGLRWAKTGHLTTFGQMLVRHVAAQAQLYSSRFYHPHAQHHRRALCASTADDVQAVPRSTPQQPLSPRQQRQLLQQQQAVQQPQQQGQPLQQQQAQQPRKQELSSTQHLRTQAQPYAVWWNTNIRSIPQQPATAPFQAMQQPQQQQHIDTTTSFSRKWQPVEQLLHNLAYQQQQAQKHRQQHALQARASSVGGSTAPRNRAPALAENRQQKWPRPRRPPSQRSQQWQLATGRGTPAVANTAAVRQLHATMAGTSSSNGVVGGSTTNSSTGGSSAATPCRLMSAPTGGRHLYGMLDQVLMQKLKAGGPCSLDYWQIWGHESMQHLWEADKQALSAAVQRLAAVSTSGPVRLVFFDLETTTRGRCVEILEIGASTAGQRPSTFCQLIRPLAHISPKSADIHGITWPDVMNKPLLPTVLLEWVEWLDQECRKSPAGSSTLVLVGHNVKTFDLNCLSAWADTLGAQQLVQLLSFQPDADGQQWQYIDTYKDLAIKLYPETQNRTALGLTAQNLRDKHLPVTNGLQDLREYFGGEQNEAHRAMDDVLTTIHIYKGMAAVSLGKPFIEITDLNAVTEQQLLPLMLAGRTKAQQQVRQQVKQNAKQQARQREKAHEQQQSPPTAVANAAAAAVRATASSQDVAKVVQQRVNVSISNALSLNSSSAGSCTSTGSNGSSSDNSNKSSSSAVSQTSQNVSASCAVDTKAVESQVTQTLEVLTEKDLRFHQQQLSNVWLPFTQELSPKLKLFTDRQCQKLQAAGFNNVLQVLLYAPKIMVHADAIRVSSVPQLSGSSTGNGSSTAMDQSNYASEAVEASAGITSDEEWSDQEGQLVRLRARCVGAFAPKKTMSKPIASWTAVFEAPTDPPEAGPVLLKVTTWEYFASAVKSYKDAQAAAATPAQVALLTGKVKPASFSQTTGGFKCSWESIGNMAVSFLQQNATTSDMASERQDSDTGAQVTAASAAPAAAAVPDAIGVGNLLPVYKACKDVKPGDWLSTARTKGIIDKALDAVRKASPDGGELVPADLLRNYNLSGWLTALEHLHAPSDMDAHKVARRRLAFQELMLVQMAQLLERYWLQRGTQQQPSLAAAASDGAGCSDSTPATALAAVGAAAAVADTIAELAEPAFSAGRKGRGGKKGKQQHIPQPNQQQQLQFLVGEQLQQQQQQQQQQLEDIPLFQRQQLQQQHWQQQEASTAHQVIDHDLSAAGRAVLPYRLTDDQDRVLAEILADMARPQAMLRLLQGDVGCGKTAVALLACLAAAGSGYQALLLAPTELLAQQHYESFTSITDQLPLSNRPRIDLLTSSTRAKEKEGLKNAVKDGKVSILVSTQAALWVREWTKLALVVVDEQHKFGVKQRERLLQELPAPPHLLLMTATPIPRTLALVQYGGLMLSTISTMPPGRRPVETHVVVDSDQTRQEVYAAINAELASGGRVYIVCPLVSENDTLEGVRAAQGEYARLSASGLFGSYGCGLLHGKLKPEEKAAVLQKFSSGDKPLLIASTVVEVGIDEPEASIMLVENAARFGLAQLHQLRGRVGRGSRASRCFLMAPAAENGVDAAVTERLRVLERSHNGLHIAEADLAIRGPGDVWGIKQSGKSSVFTNLTWKELEASPELLEYAREAAAKLLPSLGFVPGLKAALLAYNIMSLREGQQQPVLRDGVSGV